MQNPSVCTHTDVPSHPRRTVTACRGLYSHSPESFYIYITVAEAASLAKPYVSQSLVQSQGNPHVTCRGHSGTEARFEDFGFHLSVSARN